MEMKGGAGFGSWRSELVAQLRRKADSHKRSPASLLGRRSMQDCRQQWASRRGSEGQALI
jgi:hypothetical protein